MNNAIAELVPIIASAPADAKTRDAWLERLFEAHQEDQIPYIERLADHWGELCASKEVASAWADKLVGIARMALSPDKNLRGHFHGTSACLSALYRAERLHELIDLLRVDAIWPPQAVGRAGDGLAAWQRVEELRRDAGVAEQREHTSDALLVLSALGRGVADDEVSGHRGTAQARDARPGSGRGIRRSCRS